MHTTTISLSRTLLALSSMAALLTGCSGAPAEAESDNADPAGLAEPDPTQAEVTPSVEVATLTTESGAHYAFLQTSTGDLVLEINVPSGSARPELPARDADLSVFYTQLSGQPAPLTLVDAVARARALRQQTDIAPQAIAPEGDGATEAALTPANDLGGFEVTGEALTAAQFTSSYCPGGYDFLYCWTNFNGTPWVQLTSSYLAGAVSPSTCTVHFRYRYYDDGWKTLVDRYASAGSEWWYWTGGGTRSRRWEVLSSTCSQHFSVWGDY